MPYNNLSVTKNKVYMKYLKIQSSYNECKYKTCRNHLTCVLKRAEKEHYADLLQANNPNLKKKVEYIERNREWEEKQ